jgi:TM2 domain-containing membrane protein YozV
MSQGQDWSGPADTPPGQQPQAGQQYQSPQFGQQYQQPQFGQQYESPQFGQQYQQPQFGQGYQPPQGAPGYPVAPYQQGYPAGGPQVVPKNPGIALLISFFLPGVGSLYAGKVTTGVIIIACYVVSWILTIVIIGFLGVFGFWVWGMIDAYQAAQTWNRQHGLVS